MINPASVILLHGIIYDYKGNDAKQSIHFRQRFMLQSGGVSEIGTGDKTTRFVDAPLV